MSAAATEISSGEADHAAATTTTSTSGIHCSQCHKSLAGCRFLAIDDGQCCLDCFNTKLANACVSCGEKITADGKDLSYEEKHWHEKCFICVNCSAALTGQTFSLKEGSIYCANCYDEKFAARCARCGEVFRAGVRKYEFRGQQWHEQCFLCSECQQAIGGNSFIPREDAACCVPCFEAKYAQRCASCKEVVRKGGVTYKGNSYHTECLVCTNCSKQLSGLKFTSRQEQPYCPDCFGELFARKCARCNQAITGFTGTKFVSFEDRDWHSDCFVCSKCSQSLVGKGFLTEAENILCTTCKS